MLISKLLSYKHCSGLLTTKGTLRKIYSWITGRKYTILINHMFNSINLLALKEILKFAKHLRLQA
jgi:hypothetical protein